MNHPFCSLIRAKWPQGRSSQQIAQLHFAFGNGRRLYPSSLLALQLLLGAIMPNANVTTQLDRILHYCEKMLVPFCSSFATKREISWFKAFYVRNFD